MGTSKERFKLLRIPYHFCISVLCICSNHIELRHFLLVSNCFIDARIDTQSKFLLD